MNTLTLSPYTMLVNTQNEQRALSIAAQRALRKGHAVAVEIIEKNDKGIVVQATPR